MSQLELEKGFNNKCGVTLSDSVEGRVIADIMREKPGVEVSHYPAMIRIDGTGVLEFDMSEISDDLGRDFDPYSFQVEMSTHYGRMVMLDDKIMLFADPEEARKYINF
ncbi:MmoB/DmpM family protein [Fictibacillus sp. WQ 8-8]|uniref:MmoB/DmpM family protein n=1 Tax=Fictibacillus sp. WQ 8-8 TaxID=2938788 RepID=UPI00210D99BA|nr:MmoB/DmpM family protein [Fictibacillus sp. WQ 8-8]MCQ6267791.1 MmoB/DmpM family protein [Fictibacillus sp. WQ 8-8]